MVGSAGVSILCTAQTAARVHLEAGRIRDVQDSISGQALVHIDRVHDHGIGCVEGLGQGHGLLQLALPDALLKSWLIAPARGILS